MTNPFFEQLNQIKPCPQGTSVIKRNWKAAVYDISVIIPCYNCESYIEECVQSVLSVPASYSMEIIIINDGSTDGSADILKQYEQSENITVITTENQGLSDARNVGIERSAGKYLFFLDADDYIVGSTLAIVADIAFRNQADAVEGILTSVEAELQVKETYHVRTDDFLRNGFVCGVLFKRECFETIQFPNGFYYEDTIYDLRLRDSIHSVCRIDLPIYFYRQNEAGISGTTGGTIKSIDSVWITERLLQDRMQLQVGNDNESARFILEQIARNYVRTSNVSKEQKDVIFQYSCEMWMEYFENVQTSVNLAHNSLITGLRVGDYTTYKIACEFIWEEVLHRSKDMNVAISITENYIVYAYVLITSIFENNKNRNINMYIMYNNIPDEKFAIFEELEEKYGQTIICQNIPDEWIPSELPTKAYWPKETYFRGYLPYIVPQDQDRILYIDADVLVNKSLGSLYDVPFMGRSIVACRDQSVVEGDLTEQQHHFFERIASYDIKNYFNAGVILYNLEKVRNTNLAQNFLKGAVDLRDELFALDQDLLNYLLYNDVYYEDYTLYNAFARLQFNQGNDYPVMKKKACIIHFAGRKPWTGASIRYNTERLWWEYASKIPEKLYHELLENYVFEEIDSNYANNFILDIIRNRNH